MCGLPRAGQYNEQVFKAIDYILDQMSQNGIRVIVALIDYWKKTDGVEQVSHLLLCSTCALIHLIVIKGAFLPRGRVRLQTSCMRRPPKCYLSLQNVKDDELAWPAALKLANCERLAVIFLRGLMPLLPAGIAFLATM